MMLVYHFKERLTSLEAKTETVLEIINNLLKENTVLKSGYLQIIQSIQQSRNDIHSNQHNRIIVSDDESESEDDADEDIDSDEENQESDEDQPVIKQIQIHSGLTTDIDILAGIENIEELDFEKTSNEITGSEEDILEVDINDNNDEEPDLVIDLNSGEDNLEIGIEEIIVTKLDDILPDEPDDQMGDNSESEYGLENNINNYIQPIEVYRKMDISELRALVIQQGLATDTKKLKKQELLRLLTNNND
jgi:hypothetical protein